MKFIYIPDEPYICRLHIFILETLRKKNNFKQIYLKIKQIKEEKHITNKEKDIILGVYYRNIRLKWIINKMIFLWKQRNNNYITRNEMTFGFEPIYNLDINRRVDVFCKNTNSLYIFDYEELIKYIQLCLEEEEFCFPNPKEPLNPYTNIKFSMLQLISIFDRIRDILYRNKRSFPIVMILYKKCSYNIKKFKDYNISLLNIKSCERNIKDLSNIEFDRTFTKFMEDYGYDKYLCFDCIKKKHKNYRELFEPVIIQCTKEINADIPNSNFNRMMVNLINNYNMRITRRHILNCDSFKRNNPNVYIV